MNVLGIESSCDETAAAVVSGDGLVRADVVASQIAVHAPYGGVVPELASRAHMQAIVPVVVGALAKLPRGWGDVDAIAVTQGPGLAGALLVGLQVAKGLAWSRGLPLVGVNHLDGHLLAPFLRRQASDATPSFPYIALLASGGHTALYEVRSALDIAQLGQTRDDAAGEAFDKVAKVLGLGYPGGPIVDRLAAQGDPSRFPLPRPMARHAGFDFSFSGLKTAVVGIVREQGVPSTDPERADLCASFQRAVVETLVDKSVLACETRGVRSLVLTGGVAANRGLRAHAARVAGEHGIRLFVPPLQSCTDNAAMIAYAGAMKLSAGVLSGDLTVYSRDPTYRRGKVLE